MTLKNFFLLHLSLFCVACSVARQVTPEEHSHVEVRTETVIQKDTVYLELPVIVEKVQTLDTLSVLENKYAKSEACVSGGVLAHTLATKPVKEPIEVEIKTIRKDSLVFVDRVVTNTVEIEKPLRSGQRFLMNLGWLAVALIIIGIARTIYVLIVKLKHI